MCLRKLQANQHSFVICKKTKMMSLKFSTPIYCFHIQKSIESHLKGSYKNISVNTIQPKDFAKKKHKTQILHSSGVGTNLH